MVDMPKAKLLPGEVLRELIGNQMQSLQLTSHRVIKNKEQNGVTESEVIFLDKVESVQYSRRIEWGYLGAAVVLGLVFSIGGWSIRTGNSAGWGMVSGLICAALFGIAFLNSRKAKIRISAGGETIEVVSDPKTVNELISFIEIVQSYIIERRPGPAIK